MSPQAKKSHPVRKAFFWVFLLLFIGSIGLMLVSEKSGTPQAHSHVYAQRGHNSPTQNSSSSQTSLATTTALIGAAGTLSTMILAWAQFIAGRKNRDADDGR